jgi:apolipoprotein D and lipocalin family protein
MLHIISKLLLASLGLFSTLASTVFRAAKPPVQAVEAIDLTRYAGRWFEVARRPNFFEKADMSNITADYELLPSGLVSVRNSCRRGDGKHTEAVGIARALDESNTKLKVAFAPRLLRVLPFVWGNYWILDLDPDYQWALVGEPSRKYLWILSRTPQMPAAEFERLCGKAIENGYSLEDLIHPEQSAEA